MNIVPFILFVIVMTGTPGPGNLTMMGIGQTTGFRSAIPFLTGTACGCFVLDLCVALGLGTIVTESIYLNWFMKIFGLLYMSWLAVKVVKMQIETKTVKKRFTFFEGVLIHPMSPKSWAMSVIAIGQFADPASNVVSRTIVFVSAFMAGLLIFHSTWCLLGEKIMMVLKGKTIKNIFNVTTAFLMVGTTFYALFL